MIYLSTIKNTRTFIEIQGTGQYNPLPSYIKLNNTVIYQGSFVGLMLTAINRCDLSIAYSNTFDTYNNTFASDLMAAKIRSFNSNYFVIIISSYAWEPYFNKNLSQAILEIGGYLTLPFVKMTPLSPDYKFPSTLDHGHPYAFIGIPGQKFITGQNFEILRNTTNYYNYNDTQFNAIPTARIAVNIVFDSYRQFYFFRYNEVLRSNN